tara:strand:+ start:50 stop:526 length:477 start_codon:yes stop_codon:yes gene_type:complete
MAQVKITKAMVIEQILKNFQKDGVHVKKKGRSFIPQTVDDLQPRIVKRQINKKNNKHYDRAYSQLYYKLVKGPKDRAKTAKINNKLKASSRTNIVAMPEVGPTYPSIRTADSPMKGYKNVARTGRVEQMTAKKLVVNLSSSMTCTIQDNGLITVDFKS